MALCSLLLLGAHDVYAKGSGSSSRSSSSSSRSSSSSSSRSGFSSSSSRPTPPKAAPTPPKAPTTPPKATVPSKPSSGFSSPSSTTPSPAKPGPSGFSSGVSNSTKAAAVAGAGVAVASSSAVNNHNAANSAAPAKSKAQFISEFKKNNEAKYKTSFPEKPATRPSYIPTSTSVNGTNINVDWNPGTRSYGYYNGLVFVNYDPFPYIAETAYYSQQPVTRTVVHTSSSLGSAIMTAFLIILAAVAIVLAVSYLYGRNRTKRRVWK